MNMDDDTQKEKIAITCFGGAKDVSVGKSNWFELLWPKNSIPRGLILAASAQNLEQLLCKQGSKITNVSSKQTFFSSSMLPLAPPNF